MREFITIMDACDFIIGNDGGAINMSKALNKPSFIIFSPWIEKRFWSTFEDGKLNDSVHLLDYQPKLIEGKTKKQLKNQSIELYQHFKPTYFKSKLLKFIDKHRRGVHGIHLIFTMNYGPGPRIGGTWISNSIWTEDNADALLKYTKEKGYHGIDVIELGHELNMHYKEHSLFHHLMTKSWVSRPFQLAIYIAFHVEFEFAVRNSQILQPDEKIQTPPPQKN